MAVGDGEHVDRWKASGLRIYNGRWATTYDACLWWKLFSPDKWDKAACDLLSPVDSDSRVLDVGCATGRLLDSLAAMGIKHLYGVDIASRILDTARQRLSGCDAAVELRTADAEKELPWADGFFDCVTLTGVLHHFTHPGEALTEIRRVLKPHGRLIILEPWFLPPVRQVVNVFLRIFPVNGDFRFYSPAGVRRLLERAGFSRMEHARAGWCVFSVLVGKP